MNGAAMQTASPQRPPAGRSSIADTVYIPRLGFLRAQDYDFDAPVKLLDKMMHAMADREDQQIVVLSQVNGRTTVR